MHTNDDTLNVWLLTQDDFNIALKDADRILQAGIKLQPENRCDLANLIYRGMTLARSLNDWKVIEVDGLPEDGRYEVTTDADIVRIACYSSDGWTGWIGVEERPIAYREVCKPYQPQGEGNEK